MEINGELLAAQLANVKESLTKGEANAFIKAIRNNTPAAEAIAVTAATMVALDSIPPRVPLLDTMCHLLYGIHVGIAYQLALDKLELAKPTDKKKVN